MRTCLLEPIPEIYQAATYLDQALTHHLNGEFREAEELFCLSNMSVIRDWTESIWGKGGLFTQFQRTLGNPQPLPSDQRDPKRMPDNKMKSELLIRDGHFCRFCGIPVIRQEIRMKLQKKYPASIPWGRTNNKQHAAFQTLWLQYDHIIPHARGGKTIPENMIITCAPCNYGRMNYLLHEVGLSLTEIKKPSIDNWNGLSRILF